MRDFLSKAFTNIMIFLGGYATKGIIDDRATWQWGWWLFVPLLIPLILGTIAYFLFPDFFKKYFSAKSQGS